MKEIARPLLIGLTFVLVVCATALLYEYTAVIELREAIQQQCTTIRSYLVHEGRVRVLLGCPDGTQYWQWKDHE